MSKKIICLLAALATIFTCSCNKETPQDVEVSNDPELLGTWIGVSDGTTYMLTFTEDKCTIQIGDWDKSTYSYRTSQSGSGKFFTLDDALGSSIFYSVVGNQLAYMGGNSTLSYGWPVTFKKQQ